MKNPKAETPLMKQYHRIKEQYPNTILLFRLGDFFETFFEDAKHTATTLGITLTKRNNGSAEEMPLAGFPHHQLDNYLPKLVKAGYRVAVCEQLEDPKQAKGIVKRGVVEVVTPGVALYDKILDAKSNNFILGLSFDKSNKNFVGLSYADVSTGEFYIAELHISKLISIIETVNPSELVLNKNDKDIFEGLVKKLSYSPALTKLEDWIFEEEFTTNLLLDQFNTKSLKGFGIENYSIGKIAAGAILHYISETQKSKLPHLRSIKTINTSDFMILDYPTRRNLEITFDSEGSQQGSLFKLMDKTSTSMGSRLLKKWIVRPLIDLDSINSRLNKVEVFYNNYQSLLLFRDYLKEISDLERLSVRIENNRINPRDLNQLRESLLLLPKIKELINEIDKENVFGINNLKELQDLIEILENAINDDAPAQLGNGNVFKRGYNSELDSYLEAKFSGKNWVEKFKEEERLRSDIPSLKVGFNNVFGYYIEITNAHKTKIPDNYERKQTLTNAERYITPELKDIETKILGAEENIMRLENLLFQELTRKVNVFAEDITIIASQIAELDVLQSFALLAISNNYNKPSLNNGNKVLISKGRHPVVEKLLDLGVTYTENDLEIDTENTMIHIITGPNMSGKSSYLRQNALIILMAQIGSYVPAASAELGIVDRIFTRVGAQDNISSGESTFLVEMQEMANILNNATDKSFILLDEVGRGTATYDGLAIAWSIAEHINNVTNAKTLFATHYHELNELQEKYERIHNFHIEIIETTNRIIFSHKLKTGGTDLSFGIHVAKMAGLPSDVTERANEILKTFEADGEQTQIIGEKKIKPDIKNIKSKSVQNDSQLAIFTFEDDVLRSKIKNINIEEITPLKAFELLSELVSEVR